MFQIVIISLGYPALSFIFVLIYIICCSTTLLTICNKKKSLKIKKRKVVNKKKKRTSSSKKSQKATTYYVDGARAIGMLRECEKRCEGTIERARHNYVKVMDKAYEDARKEIAECKKKREEQHQKYVARLQKEELDYEATLENRNRAKLREIDKMVVKNRDKVIDDIMKVVLKIQPVMHHNVPDLRKARQTKSSLSQQITKQPSQNLSTKNQQKAKILPIVRKVSYKEPTPSESSITSSTSNSTSSDSELSIREQHKSRQKSQQENNRKQQSNVPKQK
uniref:V-type proton ATPase subunit G n=1 Tax=Meloidogyne hapla TaxID=6305 RepID=A0A1I8BB84_MELHA